MSAAWDAENIDKMREYRRKYAAANKEKTRAATRKYYAANKDKARAARRRSVAANPDKERARRRKLRGLPLATRPMPELCERGCGRKATALDHCHATGIFRGWLCHRCNAGIGLLGDTAEALQQSLDYLTKISSY